MHNPLFACTEKSFTAKWSLFSSTITFVGSLDPSPGQLSAINTATCTNTDHMTTHRHCVVSAGCLDTGEIPEVAQLPINVRSRSINLVEGHTHSQRSSEFNARTLEVADSLFQRE